MQESAEDFRFLSVSEPNFKCAPQSDKFFELINNIDHGAPTLRFSQPAWGFSPGLQVTFCKAHLNLDGFGDVKDKYFFGIPFNLKDLEGLTCMEYLQQYLQVAPRRTRTCDKIFRKFAEAGILPKEKLYEALTELTMHPLAKSPLELILNLIGLTFDELPPIDGDFWKVICAVADRLLFSRLLQRDKKTLTSKGTLETADFSTAFRQFDELDLTPELAALLRII